MQNARTYIPMEEVTAVTVKVLSGNDVNLVALSQLVAIYVVAQRLMEAGIGCGCCSGLDAYIYEDRLKNLIDEFEESTK